MRYDQFLNNVRDRGGYRDRQEAERIAQVVLAVLARRLDPGEAQHLASQLPVQAAVIVVDQAGPSAQALSTREFLAQVAERTGGSDRTAQWDASAVLSTVADAITGGELHDVLTQLPSGYAALFGRPVLSG
ncbi:Uncharacterized conserved protein, DUF2267 family [Micromonospora pattaloongensis]|uniref:Uncharacterized conserved protein, DUF2267 family n=1 Tax=Micromonospora pattaloongensis TaxID=405436 RepID=A0A1H3RSF9_9ACTN|nr:DUF2267 domain-containing protein [Micromonospora pattaloongensis]SDZ28540.1 Uncharacterized conserved protein, DUF2267 family [Micromonospora pattaloongensis]